MTDKEVKEMETEVNGTEVGSDFQAAWVKDQLTVLADQEKRLALAWKFHKLMRNDTQIQSSFDELKKVRESIAVIKESFA